MSSHPDKDRHHKTSASAKRVHFDSFQNSSSTPPSSRPATPHRKSSQSESSPKRQLRDEKNQPKSTQEESTKENLTSFPPYPFSTGHHHPTFTHYAGGLLQPGSFGPQSFPGNFGGSGSGQVPVVFPNCQKYPAQVPLNETHPFVYPVMAYANSAPANTGVNFQPQVPDTSRGPETHYYVPRHDPPLPFMHVGQLPLQSMPAMVSSQCLPHHTLCLPSVMHMHLPLVKEYPMSPCQLGWYLPTSHASCTWLIVGQPLSTDSS